MAGLSRSKVSRIARTGGSGRRRGDSSAGFLTILAVLAVIGVAVVILSRDQRLDATTPNNTPPLEPVQSETDPSKNRPGDRWFEAYGFYLCDKFAPPINSTADKFGIATQNDGVLYIHPYEKRYAGANANLGLFADSFDIKLTEDTLQLPGDDKVYKSGETKCGDQVGQLVVREWEDPAKSDRAVLIRKGIRDVRVKDKAAVTIAFVPQDKTDIPLPESATNGALGAAPEKDSQAAAAQGGFDPSQLGGLPEGPASEDPAPENPAPTSGG